MIRHPLILMLGSMIGLAPAIAVAGADSGKAPISTTSASSSAWQVTTSLRTTLRNWARRQGWPAPQFLTDADWPVDVSGAIPGSFEAALKVLAQGFGHAASRPRIEITANHVIVVSEIGAE